MKVLGRGISWAESYYCRYSSPALLAGWPHGQSMSIWAISGKNLLEGPESVLSPPLAPWNSRSEYSTGQAP
jgi:hypothetical protein